MTFLGSGDEGRKALVMVLRETKVFQDKIEPEDVSSRNAGMRILLDMFGGDGNKLMEAIINGLSGSYDSFKDDFRRESIKKAKGDK
jgi:hypothetical protein